MTSQRPPPGRGPVSPVGLFPEVAAYVQRLVAGSAEKVRKPSKAFPYPAHIEAVKLPKGFPPTFTLYKGTGSPTEHLGRFTAQCGKTASDPQKLLKQFKYSLTGPAFKWWCRLPSGSIESWDQLETLFL